MSDLAGHVEKALDGMERVLLGIRATGGHKYRELFKLSDKEFEEMAAGLAPKLRAMVISLVLAEEMLQEPCPSHNFLRNLFKSCAWKRWDEYVKRRAELFAAVDKRQAELREQAKTIMMRRAEKPAVKQTTRAEDVAAQIEAGGGPRD